MLVWIGWDQTGDTGGPTLYILDFQDDPSELNQN
ncbi:predicted protein [Botrytis cinerea T4]|uniref:Uncharacterized protein n=1 Tax=Botryotinia fuckeliana (strain T4) TaxID=999810 RepID=G2XMZ9_BOTF4|nr:predicted protein [Botrytis cinerea T4]